MLLLFAGLASLGLHLLAACADTVGRPASFYSVANAALPGAGLVIDVAVAVKCFGVATSYLIVVGDSMPKALLAFGASGAALERRVWTLVAAFAVSPVVFLRRVDGLRFTSTLALVCILAVVVLVVLFAAHVSPAFAACPPSTPALAAANGTAALPPSPPPCRLPVVPADPPMEVLRSVPIVSSP